MYRKNILNLLKEFSKSLMLKPLFPINGTSNILKDPMSKIMCQSRFNYFSFGYGFWRSWLRPRSYGVLGGDVG